jgi:hypothetical protein
MGNKAGQEREDSDETNSPASGGKRERAHEEIMRLIVRERHP